MPSGNDLSFVQRPYVAVVGAKAAPAGRRIPAAVSAMTTVLFASTLLVSAGLLFVVQPMFAKMVLPQLGGSPAVWNTCVVFFQAAMLAGYAYAHLTSRWLSLSHQAAVHLLLLLAAGVLLPIAIPQGWTPSSEATPVPSLLLLLAMVVGLPFLAVSATAPLLQSWFARTAHPSARDPYFLYAASNAGSMLALVSYPFVIEPTWALTQQSAGWTSTYAILAALIVLTAVVTGRFRKRSVDPSFDAARDGVAAETPEGLPGTAVWARRSRWVVLAFVPSSLMLGVTTFLTSDVAAVPLLWSIPLALYLLTFVLAFARRPLIPTGMVQNAMAVLVLPVVITILLGVGEPLWLVMPLHLITFFACALVVHTALAADRPSTAMLTEFYLWISAGGLLGGVFNALVAPVVFPIVLEYPLAIALACGLRPQNRFVSRSLARGTIGHIALPAGLTVVVVGALVGLAKGSATPVLLGLSAGGAAMLYLACTKHPLRLAMAMGGVVVAGTAFLQHGGELLHAERTFFGIVHVSADAESGTHKLFHGRTLHGEQHMDPERRHQPMSYYSVEGPIGQIIRSRTDILHRVAVVGLGTGALAAYAEPGQHWTFYEIDPAVERIARNAALFTHLTDCGAQCEVVLGDARVSLTASQQVRYDLIVLDAFSSDAIPAHLVTHEAVELYLSRLSEDGVLAFHVSNRHLDLRPVLGALAHGMGLSALVQSYRPGEGSVGLASDWVVIARNDGSLGSLFADERWRRLPTAMVRVWTDDYSDILSILK